MKERFKLSLPELMRQTGGGESFISPLLEVTEIEGESPVVTVTFNGVEFDRYMVSSK